MGGFDLMWEDGPVYADEGGFECLGTTGTTPLNTYLGKVINSILLLLMPLSIILNQGK